MTSKTRLSILLISTPILAFVIVGGLIGQERPSGDRAFRHLRVFDDVVQLVMSNYVEDVKVDKAMEGAMQGPRRRTRSRLGVPRRQAGASR